jgi:hypothetical protein
MLVVPAVTPQTVPAETVATDGLLLLHAPPEVELDNVIQTPIQVVDGPVSAAGDVVTVATVDTLHPEPNE